MELFSLSTNKHAQNIGIEKFCKEKFSYKIENHVMEGSGLIKA